jgi:hypothetical protein
MEKFGILFLSAVEWLYVFARMLAGNVRLGGRGVDAVSSTSPFQILSGNQPYLASS